MFARILVLIVGVGVTACALLAARQLRMQAAHDLASTRLRIVKHDSDLWRLRVEIASRVMPESVERLAGGIAPLRPMSGAREAVFAAGTEGLAEPLPNDRPTDD